MCNKTIFTNTSISIKRKKRDEINKLPMISTESLNCWDLLVQLHQEALFLVNEPLKHHLLTVLGWKLFFSLLLLWLSRSIMSATLSSWVAEPFPWSVLVLQAVFQLLSGAQNCSLECCDLSRQFYYCNDRKQQLNWWVVEQQNSRSFLLPSRNIFAHIQIYLCNRSCSHRAVSIHRTLETSIHI